MVAVTVHLLTTACTGSSPAHTELAEAVAVGREASGLLGRVAHFCGPATDASAPVGICHPVVERGPAGASFYDEPHAIEFHFESADGQMVLDYRSEAEDGVRETALSGRAFLFGRAHILSLWSLTVARASTDFEEVEDALRARIEGDDRLIELEEVRYHLREDGEESFYRTYWDSWQTPLGLFELEDGRYEGYRSPMGRWHLSAEGLVRLDGADVGEVALGGPVDARRAVVRTPDGDIEL